MLVVNVRIVGSSGTREQIKSLKEIIYKDVNDFCVAAKHEYTFCAELHELEVPKK
jgi:hypothetical protein